jgi:hypothetical protein
LTGTVPNTTNTERQLPSRWWGHICEGFTWIDHQGSEHVAGAIPDRIDRLGRSQGSKWSKWSAYC